MEDFWSVFLFFGIAAVLFSLYLFKVGKAKKLLKEAEKAKAGGDHLSAIGLFKQALWKANESPEIEKIIIHNMADIYESRSIKYDFSDYNKLMEQFAILKKKSSRKALGELGKVQKLKKELIDKMPGI